MHSFSILSFAALAVSASALAAPGVAKVTTVTVTTTTTSTKPGKPHTTTLYTTTVTKTKKGRPHTTTETKTVTGGLNAQATCLAAAGYAPGEFLVTPQEDGTTTFFDPFCNGAYGAMQDDGNFVIYPGDDNSGNGWTPYTNGFPCDAADCLAEFTSDGNFHVVNYGIEEFSTNTGGMNAQRLVLSSGQPYLVILDNNGVELYSTGTNQEAERKMSVLAVQNNKHAKNSTHTS